MILCFSHRALLIPFINPTEILRHPFHPDLANGLLHMLMRWNLPSINQRSLTNGHPIKYQVYLEELSEEFKPDFTPLFAVINKKLAAARIKDYIGGFKNFLGRYVIPGTKYLMTLFRELGCLVFEKKSHTLDSTECMVAKFTKCGRKAVSFTFSRGYAPSLAKELGNKPNLSWLIPRKTYDTKIKAIAKDVLRGETGALRYRYVGSIDVNGVVHHTPESWANDIVGTELLNATDQEGLIVQHRSPLRVSHHVT
jgi:hypothetical protein